MRNPAPARQKKQVSRCVDGGRWPYSHGATAVLMFLTTLRSKIAAMISLITTSKSRLETSHIRGAQGGAVPVLSPGSYGGRKASRHSPWGDSADRPGPLWLQHTRPCGQAYQICGSATFTGLWRNGSASDSRSEGWAFESLWLHIAGKTHMPSHSR